jgi:cephalosporin-C deacetylase-like acetyl esterase
MGNTFSKAMEKVDPEYVVGQRSGTYEKVQGYDVLESGKSGLRIAGVVSG